MTTKNKDKEYVFTATGGWDIDGKLKPQHDASGNVVGFKLSDGRIVQLVIALEVWDKKTDSYQYVTSENQMEKLGFYGLDYGRLDFQQTNDRYSEQV